MVSTARTILLRSLPVVLAVAVGAAVMAAGELGRSSSFFPGVGLACPLALGATFPDRDTRPLVVGYLVPAFVLGFIQMPEALTVLVIVAPFGALVVWLAMDLGQKLRRLSREVALRRRHRVNGKMPPPPAD